MNRIDTHLHLLYPDRFSYDWTSGFPALAEKPFRIDEYRVASQAAGITESIFMEVDVPHEQAANEASFFCSLADDPANRIAGVIASCRPENPGLAAHLEATAHPRLCGYRRILHTQPDDLSTGALFRENVARIGGAGFTFDICALPHQLPIVADLVDACPETRFVLDHCGVPNIASGDLDAWRTTLRDISRRPHLACKISGIIAYTAPDRVNADSLRPVVEHAIECFGWDRVVWGSDWPVCNLTSDLSTWVRLIDEILAGCSHDELKRLYTNNARRIYRLKTSGSPALSPS